MKEWIEKFRLKRVAVVLGLILAFAIGYSIASPEKEDHEGHAHAEEEGTVWTCSMHPQVKQNEPGLCPICAMDLIPLKPGGTELAPNEVEFSEHALKMARIRTAPVLRALDESSRLRLLGQVYEDESSKRMVTAWIGGRIDKLHVTVTGQKIRRGQTIATLYSPEVYAAHRELVVARAQVEGLKDASDLARRGAQTTLEAARTKLRLLGVPDTEIQKMEGESSPRTQIQIRSPFAGTVVERLAAEGSYISAGQPLYELSNLNTVWVQLEAYEADLALLELGQRVKLEFNGLPEAYEGEIAFIDPVLDASRRVARVRVEVQNPDGRLLPGMYAQASVERSGDGAAPLVIPETAPIFTGRRSIVYVEVPGRDVPTYASREVRLGPKMGSVYPVVAGLQEAERVVIHGAFALDADLQIRGGLSMMSYADDTQENPLDDVVEINADEKTRLAAVVDAYLQIQKALAEDSHADAIAANQMMLDAVEAIGMGNADRQLFAAAWKSIRDELLYSARSLGNSTTLEGARAPFEPMSAGIERLLKIFGNPTEKSLALAHCPMAFNNRGASWIQEEGKIDNAYFGATMRMCGEIEESVNTGAYLVEKVAK